MSKKTKNTTKTPAIQLEGSIPWIEKYRPKDIDDVILDPTIERQIKIFIEDKDGVHMIITGQPGVGKTTAVRCIARKILGENLNKGYQELNASEDRGVKTITTIIPPFCKKIVDFTEPKIILLDEAENLTGKCQYDIITMIKEYGSKTRFIFTCNDSTKIIEDLQSICRIIRFKQLSKEQIAKYLNKICECESLKQEKAGIDMLCYISNGDMRKAINNLQLTAYSFDKSITKRHVLTICKMPDPEEIRSIIDLCLKKELVSAVGEMDNIISEGYYYLDIVTGFIFVLSTCDMNGMSEYTKLKLIDTVNQTKVVISSGLRTKLQLTAMICRLIRCYEESLQD